MTMIATTATGTTSGLAQRAQRLRSAMNDADVGPLVVAAEVIEIVNQWDAHRADAGGVDASTWLIRTFGTGRTLPWFQRRHEAVQKLGEAIRRTIHHDVAVWVVQSLPESIWQGVKMALMRARKDNGDNPVSLGRARIIVQKEFQPKPRARKCAGCARRDEYVQRLEEKLSAAGIPLPE